MGSECLWDSATAPERHDRRKSAAICLDILDFLQPTWQWGGTWKIHFLLKGAPVSCHVSWREGRFLGCFPKYCEYGSPETCHLSVSVRLGTGAPFA